jgi:hypothetical protein
MNHYLVFVQCRILSFPEEPSSLHVLSSSMLVAPYYVSRVSNDNVHQSLEVVFGDKDIHLLLGVAKEKVGDLPLNMCSTLQNNSCNNIPKCVMGYCILIPARSVPIDLLQKLARLRKARN